jgi:hypothetical protein
MKKYKIEGGGLIVSPPSLYQLSDNLTLFSPADFPQTQWGQPETRAAARGEVRKLCKTELVFDRFSFRLEILLLPECVQKGFGILPLIIQARRPAGRRTGIILP